MREAYQPAGEVDDGRPSKRRTKRPAVAMVAGAVFAMLGVSILASGAILEGVGVLIVGIGCACIGIDPSRGERRTGH